jgi:hypothetical protein
MSATYYYDLGIHRVNYGVYKCFDFQLKGPSLVAFIGLLGWKVIVINPLR